MQWLGYGSGLLAVALIFAFFVRSVGRPFYALPEFAAEIISTQPSAPRRVGIGAVTWAVLRGLDGAIYSTSGVFLTALGVDLLFTKTGIGRPIALVAIAVGLLCAGLVIFRVSDMWQALRYGEVTQVEATVTTVGRARVYGSPWGDLFSGRAARGEYRDLDGGGVGKYYMQQQWALRIKPGAAMWVVRRKSRVVLYAPRAAPSES